MPMTSVNIAVGQLGLQPTLSALGAVLAIRQETQTQLATLLPISAGEHMSLVCNQMSRMLRTVG